MFWKRLITSIFVLAALTVSPCMAAEDPFAIDATIQSGPYRGNPVDTDRFRSIRALNPEERLQFGINNPNDYAVANFHHNGRFWVATFPKDSVKDVIFQLMEIMGGKAEHSQIRFKLKDDVQVRLIEQTSSTIKTESRLPGDVVFSLAATPIKGRKHRTAVDGNLGKLAISLELSSVSENSFERIANGDRVRQFLLEMPSEKDKQDLLDSAISRAEKVGIGKPYLMFTRNCTTEALCVIDEILERNHPGFVKRIHESFYPERAIRSRGIVSRQMENLEVELGLSCAKRIEATLLEMLMGEVNIP